MDHNGVMVNTSYFHSSDPKSFPGEGEYDLLVNVDRVNFLLKNNKGKDRKSHFFIFVVWKALIAGGWVVVAWGKKSHFGPAEISFFMYLV